MWLLKFLFFCSVTEKLNVHGMQTLTVQENNSTIVKSESQNFPCILQYITETFGTSNI